MKLELETRTGSPVPSLTKHEDEVRVLGGGDRAAGAPEAAGRWGQEVGRPGQEVGTRVATVPRRVGPSSQRLLLVCVLSSWDSGNSGKWSFWLRALGGGCNLGDLKDPPSDPERVTHCSGTGAGSEDSV